MTITDLNIQLQEEFIFSETNEENAAQHILIVELEQNELIFTARNHKSQELTWLKNYTLKNPAPETENNIEIPDLNLPWQSIRVFINTFGNTLIPSALFIEEESSKYYEANSGSFKGTLLFDNLRTQGMINLYEVPKNTSELIQKYFPAAKIKHSNSSLLQAQSKIELNKNTERIYLHASSEFIVLSFYKNGALQFFNSFVYEAETDILFHSLSVCNSFGLNPESAEIILSGKFNNLLKETLTRYMPSWKMIPTASWLHEDFPYARYYSLIEAFHCE